MGGWARGASSATFVGSVGGSLGFPIEQLLLILLGPLGVVVGLLHVHARLLSGFIIVAMMGASDIFRTGDCLVFSILFELPRFDP